MTGQDTNNQTNPKRKRTVLNEFYSGSIFEKINAISSIGGVVIAFVALWVTFQISGLEGYFQSVLEPNSKLQLSDFSDL